MFLSLQIFSHHMKSIWCCSLTEMSAVLSIITEKTQTWFLQSVFSVRHGPWFLSSHWKYCVRATCSPYVRAMTVTPWYPKHVNAVTGSSWTPHLCFLGWHERYWTMDRIANKAVLASDICLYLPAEIDAATFKPTLVAATVLTAALCRFDFSLIWNLSSALAQQQIPCFLQHSRLSMCICLSS